MIGLNGIININKPEGLTSHDIVNKIRKFSNQKKVGHTGTLDPLASGLLTICLGKGTRLFDLIANYEKEYVTTLKLGIETDTQDSQGVITRKAIVDTNVDEIEKVLNSFVGDLVQMPPMYSAIKKDGKKLYEYARKGIEVERELRNIKIFYIEILKINLDDKTVSFKVGCSKGTYIRTLCNDIGLKLGCFAHMISLKRTKNGIFNIENSYTLDFVESYCKNNDFEKLLVPIDSVFVDYKKIIIDQEGTKRLKNGNIVLDNMFKDIYSIKDGERIRVYDMEGNFLAICIMQKDNEERNYLKIAKGFYEV
jgi:tRNA pseudouridine55 synthase